MCKVFKNCFLISARKFFALAIISAFFLNTESVLAEEEIHPPKTAFDTIDIFKDTKSPVGFFGKDFNGNVVDLSAEKKVEKKTDLQSASTNDSFAQNENELDQAILKERKAILGRVDQDAPESFKDMVVAYRKGDREGANKAADRYVSYLANLMFELRELTKIIGDALVRHRLAEEEDWVGVEQFIDYQLATDVKKGNSLLKVTQEEAMKRIIPDKNSEAEIYYFFTLNCKWCRDMAPDIERLWRVTQGDPKLKMVALTLGPQPKSWIQSYRSYTGLSLPIMEGAKIAKSFNIAFAPAVVIVTPSNNTAYLKTGKQEFKNLYEFVRKAQGLPTQVTPAVAKLMNTTIGQIEKVQKSSGGILVKNTSQAGAGKIVVDEQIIGKF